MSYMSQSLPRWSFLSCWQWDQSSWNLSWWPPSAGGETGECDQFRKQPNQSLTSKTNNKSSSIKSLCFSTGPTLQVEQSADIFYYLNADHTDTTAFCGLQQEFRLVLIMTVRCRLNCSWIRDWGFTYNLHWCVPTVIWLASFEAVVISIHNEINLNELTWKLIEMGDLWTLLIDWQGFFRSNAGFF